MIRRMGDGGRRWSVLAVGVFAIGCTGAVEERYAVEELELPVDTTVQRARPAAATRAPEVEGFLTIEGVRQAMTFRLYQSPAGFPFEFETYLPEDVEADPVSSGEGDAIAFRPAFGGEEEQRATLSVTVPAGAPTAAEALTLVRQLARTMGQTERVENGGYTWSLEEHRFRSPEAVGSVALGRHDGSYFYVITAYPPEMGDGFGPRVARILGEWRWADGSRLGS